MPIVILSSWSCTPGATVAERLCSLLECESIKNNVLANASLLSGIPQSKLQRAFSDPPSFFGMSVGTRKVRVAHIQAALSARLRDDHALYDGPFGVHLVRGVSHILTVRIQSNLEDRIALKVQREGCISHDAKKSILAQDAQRLELARLLFDADDDNDDLYDVSINTSLMDVDRAVELIADKAGQDRYKPTTYSIACLQEQALAHRVKATLVDLDPEVQVAVHSGSVSVRIRAQGMRGKNKITLSRQRVAGIEGVNDLKIEPVKDPLARFAL
jgi:two-component system response regulator CpxR